MWSQYETFHATLERLATAPVLDVSALAGVSPAYNAFLASVDRWKASTVIQYTTLFLLPLFCLSLNLGGLLLARRLRRQSATQLHRLSMGSFNVDLNTVTEETTVAPPPPLVDPDRRGSTTSALRKLAVKKHAEGDVEMELASQQAVELLGMLKAESDLVTVSRSPSRVSSSALTLRTLLSTASLLPWARLLFSYSRSILPRWWAPAVTSTANGLCEFLLGASSSRLHRADPSS